MSEVQSRPSLPPRGRGSARGRGSSLGRGGTGRGSRTNGETDFRNASQSLEDQGEVGKLKKQYASQLKILREALPDWTDEDLLLSLEENGGDADLTLNRIFEGTVSQFSEVKKKGDRSRSKVKETPAIETTASPIPRAGRGRGTTDVPRGSRSGRGSDRGRMAGRGRGGAGLGTTNGHKVNHSGGHEFVAEDSGAAFGQELVDSTKAYSEQLPTRPKPQLERKPVARPWADLFKTQTPQPVIEQPPLLSQPPVPPPQQQAPPSPPQKEEEPEPLPAPESEPLLPPTPPPIEPALPEPTEEPEPALPKSPSPEPLEPEPTPVPEITTEEDENLEEPIQQPLTEENLEKVEDIAPPVPIETEASTIATSVPPPRSEKAPSTPQTRPAALATPKLSSGRISRRALEQQEAVIMPANHAVDRATVQFGSISFNGSVDDLENEEEPEPAETASQPPVSSPLSQPVTALPPTPFQVSIPQQPVQQPQQPQQPQQSQQSQQSVSDAIPTPRQAPGLPAQPSFQAPVQQQQQQQHNHHQNHQHQHQHHQQPSPQPPLTPQNINLQQQPQLSNRFSTAEQTQAQKPYESFHHIPQQHTPQTQAAQLPPPVPPTQPQQTQQQAYAYSPATHTQHQQQQTHQQTHPSQVGLGGLTSIPDQYQTYYSSDISRVGAAPSFNYYTNPYSQPTQQDVTSLPRAASGLGNSADTASQLPTAPSQAQQAASRFGSGQEAAAHGTPSPGIPAPPSTQAPQPQQTAAHQQYPMQPYYHHPGYYYMNQVFNYDLPYSATYELSEAFFLSQQFYPYQAPFGSKQQGIYSQPHTSFTPQYTEHTSSLTGLSGFGGPTTQGRDSGVGLSDYGRTAAVSQAQQTHPQHSSANFGGLPNFLNARGIPEQQQLGGGVGQQQAGQQSQSDDSLKPFGDSKPPTGPASNPSLQGQQRPGSATSGAANLGPQQGAQPQGGMGYPASFNHHLHGHQQQPHHSMGAAQAYSQYSMYGQYPYGQSNNRQTTAGGWGGYH